jgi:hypothetical protein
LDQNAIWQRRQAQVSNTNITYNNVHNPAFETDKPMLTLVATVEVVAEASGALAGGLTKVCKLCQQAGFFPSARSKEEKMIAHLVDV